MNQYPPHSFIESLSRSHKADKLPIWEEIYRKAFPNFKAMVNHREDGEHQRAGIDRSIILTNSRQLLIDEKVRWKMFDDVLLEFMSDAERGTPGWACKAIRADFIAYAIVYIGKAYMLPVIQLHAAWAKHGEEWKRMYGIKPSENSEFGRQWTTLNVPVPVKTLFAAIGSNLRISFTPLKQEVANAR